MTIKEISLAVTNGEIILRIQLWIVISLSKMASWTVFKGSVLIFRLYYISVASSGVLGNPPAMPCLF